MIALNLNGCTFWDLVCDLAFRKIHFPVGMSRLPMKGTWHKLVLHTAVNGACVQRGGTRVGRQALGIDKVWLLTFSMEVYGVTFSGQVPAAVVLLQCATLSCTITFRPTCWMPVKSLPTSIHTETNLFRITCA